MIYLAGPIDGIPYSESMEWRTWLTNALPDYVFFNPAAPYKNVNNLPVEAHNICEINNKALEVSSVVVAYLNGEGRAIGTIREIEKAVVSRTPVVVILDSEHHHVSLCDTIVVKNTDEAVEAIKGLI